MLVALDDVPEALGAGSFFLSPTTLSSWANIARGKRSGRGI